MAFYRIEWRRSAVKDLRGLPTPEIARIVKAVDGLALDPRPPGSLKLSGSDVSFRIRVGVYRVLYEIFDGRLIIEVIKVGHRKDIYR